MPEAENANLSQIWSDWILEHMGRITVFYALQCKEGRKEIVLFLYCLLI